MAESIVANNSTRKRENSNCGEDMVLSIPFPSYSNLDDVDRSGSVVVGNTTFSTKRRQSSPCSDSGDEYILMSAARNGALDTVKKCIQDGMDLHKPDKNGLTALFYSVKSHNTDLISFLLQQGMNIRKQAVKGKTVIMYSILYGNEATLECLCEYNSRLDSMMVEQADATSPHTKELMYRTKDLLNVQDNDGCTALMYACANHQASYVEVLLRYGAQIHICDFKGQNALSIAINRNAADCVVALLRKGEFVDTRWKEFPFGALLSACRRESHEIIHLLIQYPRYFHQFVEEMMQSPSRSDIVTVEIAYREMQAHLHVATREQITLICIQEAKTCLQYLLRVAAGNRASGVSLSGCADMVRFCLKIYKVLSQKQELSEMDEYWGCIEEFTTKQRMRYERWKHHNEAIEATSSSSSSNHSEEEAPLEEFSKRVRKMKPTKMMRLLLALIEIYVVGHFNLKMMANAETDTKKEADPIHPSLHAYLSQNREFFE